METDNIVKPISFGLNIADGKWHRLGFSIKGNTIVLFADCTQQITRELKRNNQIPISNDGILIIGQQLMDANLFLVCY